MSTALPTNHWKLGLFLTAGFFSLVGALGWFGATRLEREAMEAHYFFDQDVNGLEIGSPVKFRGVTIGKVTTIRAASSTSGWAPGTSTTRPRASPRGRTRSTSSRTVK